MWTLLCVCNVLFTTEYYVRTNSICGAELRNNEAPASSLCSGFSGSTLSTRDDSQHTAELVSTRVCSYLLFQHSFVCIFHMHRTYHVCLVLHLFNALFGKEHRMSKQRNLLYLSLTPSCLRPNSKVTARHISFVLGFTFIYLFIYLFVI